MLQRYLMFWLIVSSGVAYFWPTVLPGAFDPFLPSKLALTIAIFLVMFAVGSLLRLDEVQDVGRRWPAVLFGTSVQYGSMPLLAYLIGHAFGFDKATLLGVIMVVGMNDSMRRALTLEIGMQNCGLGTTLVLQLFPGEEYRAAAIPTAAYTFGCVFTATILAYLWSRIPVRDGPLAADVQKTTP